MHRDIRLHGLANGRVEYFVLAASADPYQHYFFNLLPDTGQLRIFSPGNELLIGDQGITYRGNGGYFCEYMFGVEQPPADLSKVEIINRLVMYGARSGEGGSLSFSDRTGISESYDRLFFEGHAVCNYLFFVHSSLLPAGLGGQQQELVRRLGKAIKRSEAIGQERDDDLIGEIYPLLQDSSAQLFVVKLVDTHHRQYRDLFRQLYFRNKKISDEDFTRLVQLADDHGIDRYQQERMRIDVMYRHPANKRIVDEYRSILLACNAKGGISRLDNARLTRLKTLSVRNKIPGALFHTLDEMLQTGRSLADSEELDYLSATREVLEGIFLREKEIDSHIDSEDLLRLLRAKKRAMENRDQGFDQLMLDAGKECDEKIRDGSDYRLMEDFSLVITYLDRFDSVASLISQLAFMETVRVSEEMLRGLLEHKAAFDSLTPGCFSQLFVNDLYHNAYLGRFGRRKVTTLMEGLAAIEARTATIEDLHRQLHDIDQQERVSLVLLEHVRDRIRNFYSKFSTPAEQETLRREVAEELAAKQSVQADLLDSLFNQTIVTIKTEAMYLHTLLPTIIATQDMSLREDFLENSGLDRFYVEELEREYFERNGLDLEELNQIRKGLS